MLDGLISRAVCASCCRVGTRKILLDRWIPFFDDIIPLLGSCALELLCPLKRMGWYHRAYGYSGTVDARGSLVGDDAGVAVLMVCVKVVFLLDTCWCSFDEAYGRPLDESYVSC